MKRIIISLSLQKGVTMYPLLSYINTELDKKIHSYYIKPYTL